MNLPNLEKVFFTSDTHFGHKSIISLCNRPFIDISEMDAALIKNWNAVVPKDGLVFHLGDVSFRNKADTLEILNSLEGRIILIRGNHDKKFNEAIESRFEEIHNYYELNLDGVKVVLCHFPIESWNRMAHGAWHLHGHSHGNMKEFGMRMDIGVDAIKDYTPTSYYRVKGLMKNRKPEFRDHHYPKETNDTK